ncbi:hypothetical protein [Micromonospora sp. WMMD714]|uniref:hypothetical protein n=1 Tax=Micromonospora sp. WMMD714 TaxID=3016097 RepID=UPI00249BE89F|nr:hypothetical protein [Micromonospora sp. WMMD714]WFE64105.1 hypothetical protein O7625_12830 [Micromonospora sp. WMMD714]
MRRLVLVGLGILVGAAGCAPAGSVPGGLASGGSVPSGAASGGAVVGGASGGADRQGEEFDRRAAEVAGAWRPGPDWSTGYLPLQDATVLTGDPGFDADTETAFRSGWYRDQIELPTVVPADAAIRFPDGALSVPLVSAAEAYRQLDQGDPPPCEGRPRVPPAPSPTVAGRPDDPVATRAATACVPLTVTGVTLGTAEIRTSRGIAAVPAWLFTVAELTTAVARLAVAPRAVTAVPVPATPSRTLPGGVAGVDRLRRVDGDRLTYDVALGACDSGPAALVREGDDVVVVGGGTVPGTGECIELAVLKPVTVTLAAPLGTRPVLDVATGRVLTLAAH